MIDTRLIGPKDDQYAVLSLGTVWLATTKKPYAEAVSAAVAATIAGGGAADAAPSATGEPVAWCVGYDDPMMGRIHSDPTMHKPQAEALAERNGLALISLYAGSPPVEVAAIPVPTGCGAIFKTPEGWSCDCERDHPAPCAKGERSDDAGGRPE